MEDNIPHLLDRYVKQQATLEEMVALASWVKNVKDDALLQPLLEQSWNEFVGNDEMRKGKPEMILQHILNNPSVAPVRKLPFYKTNWLRYAAIVIVILITGAGIWLMNTNTKQQHTLISDQHEPLKKDRAPGISKATWILSDGKQIQLDSTVLDLTLSQTPFQETAKPLEMQYNTLQTPKGGQYQLVLPDGSRVWLNAASSIRYPTQFSKKERVIELTGEAYFEIAKAKPGTTAPFKVKVNDQEIQVLATAFNINAYEDESTVNTTLLEGSVRVHKGNKHVLLKPGQQAQVSEQIQLINNTDLDKVMAWKNGLFNFNGADVKAVMQQLARWYNIEVKYEGPIPMQKFRGKMDRGLTLMQVLKILNDAEIKYKLEGTTLIVSQ